MSYHWRVSGSACATSDSCVRGGPGGRDALSREVRWLGHGVGLVSAREGRMRPSLPRVGLLSPAFSLKR